MRISDWSSDVCSSDLAGARQVQGTVNGLGERCGNANLISLIASLKLKSDYDIGLDDRALAQLTHVSRLLDERLTRQPQRNAAYVRESALAPQARPHASAAAQEPRTTRPSAPAPGRTPPPTRSPRTTAGQG